MNSNSQQISVLLENRKCLGCVLFPNFSLTNSTPVLPSMPPKKYCKKCGILISSELMEKAYWHEMGYSKDWSKLFCGKVKHLKTA